MNTGLIGKAHKHNNNSNEPTKIGKALNLLLFIVIGIPVIFFLTGLITWYILTPFIGMPHLHSVTDFIITTCMIGGIVAIAMESFK